MSQLMLHPAPPVAHPVARDRVGWASLTVIGVVGGTLSGLFAVGGGVLMVPLLVWRLGMDQRRATATALAAIVPTSLVSSVLYLAHGEVDLVAAAVVAVGATGGAVVGSRVLRHLPVDQLRWWFVGFILVIALRLVLVPPARTGHDVELSPSVALVYLAVGLLMGLASGLFGIGGGIIAVPLLVSFVAMSDLVAKGTSLLVSVPTSAVGTAANRRAGLVDLRTGLVVGVVATITSIPAVTLAMAVPPRLSGLLFAALLLGVAAQIVVKSVAATRTRGAR